MPEYTRYSVEPEDIPRRRRERKKKKAKSRSRAWLVVKLFVVALLLALIAGLAVAAGAIYALSRDLPSLENLRRHTNAVNTVLYDRTGKNVIAELHGAENRVLVPSEKIPQVMKDATVAVEDERFYEHHGIDYLGVARAMLQNLRAGGIVQGGSTITEQYVKNAYVGDERTYKRKIREAVLAWQLEDRWTKDKILTEYLNTVYYGAGAYGVEAAARTYFHKHASHLNLKEAALLAALPKFPSAYSPTTDKKMATEQRNKVLQLMADQGYVSQARADELMASKLKVYKHPPNLNNSMADYFVDYVTRQLTKRYGSAMVFEGGLKVVTSIDLEWQQEAIDIIKSTTEPLDFGFKPSAALVAIDPANGYIRTMVGGLDYKKQKFNLAWQAKRQAGSSMKPFVLTNAVEQGMDPNSTYYNSKSPIIIPMGAYAAPWVVNGDGPGGPESVSAATTISDNVVYAQLSVDADPEKTVEVAHRMGITSPLDAVPSITLGTSGVTPLEMADAYATLAANGVHHKPQAIVKVYSKNGDLDWKPKTTGNRAIPAGVASVVTQCLERVTVAPGTGYLTASYFPYPRAGKTGTTENGWDVWYSGYTPNLAAAVWMGDAEKNSPMNGAYGGTYCAPMWAKFFAAALKDADHPSFKSFPWTFSPWEGKMQTSASPSASPSGSASPSPGPTKTIKPTAQPTKTSPPTPQPTPTKTKPPQPTPTPTGTPSAAPKQLVVSWTPAGRWDLGAADVRSAGPGSGGSGVAGAIAGWLAGLLGL
jgi:membrane peptidoglycan carboxypeptidase